VPCSNQACVANGNTASCTGNCTPGATECTNNGVSTCSGVGAWGPPQACTNQTCLVTGTTAACKGVCAPNQVECNTTTAQQSCSASGTWATPTNCVNQTCVGSGPGSQCQGQCAPNQAQCSGQQPQNCSPSGMWQNNGNSCGGRACFNGECTGSDCSSFVPGTCASATCDFRSNTCCVNLSGGSSPCLSGVDASCPASTTIDYAPAHCRYSCDCPAGQSCCGELNLSLLKGAVECQLVPDNGSCVAPGPGYITAQTCASDEECKNGQPCVAQSCFGTTYYFCGLQSQAPFNCTTVSAQ
jgi:hypothetical protein